MNKQNTMTKTKSKNVSGKLVKPKRPFPSVTLEEALKIPQKIKEFNGANPWPPSELAQACGVTSKSSTFF
jgi:hypothetical protein